MSSDFLLELISRHKADHNSGLDISVEHLGNSLEPSSFVLNLVSFNREWVKRRSTIDFEPHFRHLPITGAQGGICPPTGPLCWFAVLIPNDHNQLKNNLDIIFTQIVVLGGPEEHWVEEIDGILVEFPNVFRGFVPLTDNLRSVKNQILLHLVVESQADQTFDDVVAVKSFVVGDGNTFGRFDRDLGTTGSGHWTGFGPVFWLLLLWS